MSKRKIQTVKIIRNHGAEPLPDAPNPSSSVGPVHQIGLKIRCPNPLFERWLQQMLARAEEQGSMSRIPLQKALASLRRYPLPIASGRDCFMLADFGKTICEALEKKQRAYEGTTMMDLDGRVEELLNDQSLEFYGKLVRGGQEDVTEKGVQEDEQFEMPDDSVFDNLHLAESHVMNIADPRAVLLVDTQETIGKSKTNLDRTLKELEQYEVDHQVRRLSVGDFLWIVRDSAGKEFILPYIVERKRMDDLASSIKDGRFHEQKFRLKQCGLANVVYLIEHLGNNRQVGVPASTLSQAAINTLVQNFTVKYTENHSHTVLYLSTMTKLLNKSLKGKSFWNVTNLPQETITAAAEDFSLKQKTIPVLAFETFQKQSSKTRDCTIKELFMKQLLQIKLLSIEKVAAIVKRYPTPRRLFLAYEKCTSEQEKEALLNLPFGPVNKTIGLKLSRIVYHLFMSEIYQR